MGYLGTVPKTGSKTPSVPNPILATAWTVEIRPDDGLPPADFEVYHIAITGPGGTFRVYLDDELYSVAVRGDINEYDPNNAIFVRRGQTIFFYWSTGSGSAPRVWIRCRQPEVGRI